MGDQGPGPADVWLAATACVEALSPLANRDWSLPAGDLEWSALQTLDHIIDALGFYSAHLALQGDERLPFETGSIVAKHNGQIRASSADLLVGLEAMAAVLAYVAAAVPPTARSVAYRDRPPLGPSEFIRLACIEMLIHTYDIRSGFGEVFQPPEALPIKLVEPWTEPLAVDAWTRLLWRCGRVSVPPYGRLSPDWTTVNSLPLIHP